MIASGSSALGLACAVCYGNASDPLVKGAIAGVAVLGGFILFVLSAIVLVGVQFARRANRLSPGGPGGSIARASGAPAQPPAR